MTSSEPPGRVLAIHAHPDDAEIFCAGTLALLASQGWSVDIITMTPGELGGVGMSRDECGAQRLAEAQRAAAVLGATYLCLDGQDGYLIDTAEHRKATLSMLRRVRPTLIITHLPFDYHPDHRATANIVEAAAMISTLATAPVPEPPLPTTPALYHSATLGRTDILGDPLRSPHLFVDITSVIDTKRTMLQYHTTQQDLMRHMHGMEDFFGAMLEANRHDGDHIGRPYAESFWQHMGAGFPRHPLLQTSLSTWVHQP